MQKFRMKYVGILYKAELHACRRNLYSSEPNVGADGYETLFDHDTAPVTERAHAAPTRVNI